MAVPPEEWSALLNTGPGAGLMLASAAAWEALAQEYLGAAEQLTAALAEASDTWQGDGADGYLRAHMPFLLWLLEMGRHCLRAAAGEQAAAAGYLAAVAQMPTPEEIFVNRTVLTVLLATNFLGLNTAPITHVELHYAVMWVRAAAAMAAYQGETDAAKAVASADERQAVELLNLAVHETGEDGVEMRSLENPYASQPVQDYSDYFNPFVGYEAIPSPGEAATIDQAGVDFSAGLALIAPLALPTGPSAAPALGAAIAPPASLPAGIAQHVRDVQSVSPTGAVKELGPSRGITAPGPRGVGALGFAGAHIEESAAQPAGLVRVADDEWGGVRRVPMVPSTWASQEQAAWDPPLVT